MHADQRSGIAAARVATNKGSRWIFVYGFPKNERGNIDKDEEDALTKLARLPVDRSRPRSSLARCAAYAGPMSPRGPGQDVEGLQPSSGDGMMRGLFLLPHD